MDNNTISRIIGNTELTDSEKVNILTNKIEQSEENAVKQAIEDEMLATFYDIYDNKIGERPKNSISVEYIQAIVINEVIISFSTKQKKVSNKEMIKHLRMTSENKLSDEVYKKKVGSIPAHYPNLWLEKTMMEYIGVRDDIFQKLFSGDGK